MTLYGHMAKYWLTISAIIRSFLRRVKTECSDKPNICRLPQLALRLALYCDGLQLEMPTDQKGPRANKLARGVILSREVARVNRIEFLEERQVRACNLHVHQVVHGHPRLRQHFLFPIQ